MLYYIQILSDEGDMHMKKRLSKVLALVSVMVMLTISLTGCGKTTCDICGNEARCKSVEFFGEKVNICGDCQDGLDAINSLF